MSLINIISAIGNNKSVAPLFVRDCCIEIPTKLGLTYKQNLKDSKQTANNALRERFIDEYGSSAIWIGGPIFLDKFSNRIIKKFGYNPNVNMSLLKETKDQGLLLNINKFKDKAPEAVKDMQKVLKNKSTYQRMQACKFGVSTIIPVVLMGFILPKLNFKLTEIINKKQSERKTNDLNRKDKKGNSIFISFKGLSSKFANMSNLNKMAVTDTGLTIGRVYTGRNPYEQLELGFKNIMMMLLNFVFPIYLAKGLDKISKKMFGVNVNLDPKLMSNRNFLSMLKDNTLETPAASEDIIEFLDKKPNSAFSKLCEEYCGVKYFKNRIRDPREFVDTEKIYKFKKEIDIFKNACKKSGNIYKYAKKGTKVKTANIFANIGISSFLLAVALPEVIFLLRKKVTGSDAEPGLVK